MPVFGSTIRFEAGRRGGVGEGRGERFSVGSVFDRFTNPKRFRAIRFPAQKRRVPVPMGNPVLQRQPAPKERVVVPRAPILKVAPRPRAVVAPKNAVPIPKTMAPARPLPHQVVISPTASPKKTVFEQPERVLRPTVEPVVEWIPQHRDTNWDEVYKQYVELNVPRSEEVAVDWGDIAGQVIGGAIGGLFDPFGMGSAAQQFVSGPPSTVDYGVATQPRKVTVDTVTGQVTPCRRRRRRKLLTNGDFNDLLRISTLPNTANVRVAIAKAIR